VPRVPLYQVDAFASSPFAGNPAAVVVLDTWLADSVLQQIAAENNLSETAFVVGGAGRYQLRWFTPLVEAQLCGHATLAASHALLTETGDSSDILTFETLSGELTVRATGSGYEMDFPLLRAEPIAHDPAVAEALGVGPDDLLLARDLVAVVADAATVRGLRPDMGKLAALQGRAIAVTAPGTGDDADVDFVSRFFAPAEGIPEDPVTGSAHCSLAPFWAARLGKSVLRARQVSARGGELTCELVGDRIKLRGEAVTVIRGTLEIL
jgi:PhzF family phenazine biosynthesis protein